MKDAPDLITGIAELSVIFRSLNFEVPEAIVLKSHDEGMRLLSYLLGKQHFIYDPRTARGPVEGENGAVYMEIEIYGIKVRWPAQKLTYRANDGRVAWKWV